MTGCASLVSLNDVAMFGSVCTVNSGVGCEYGNGTVLDGASCCSMSNVVLCPMKVVPGVVTAYEFALLHQ